MRSLLTILAVGALSCTASHAQTAAGAPPAGSSATSNSGAATKGSPDTSASLPSGGGATPSPAAPLQSPESKKEAKDGASAEPAKR